MIATRTAGPPSSAASPATPFVVSPPELLFGVLDVVPGRDETVGAMTTAPWMTRADRSPSVAGLGVLIDDVFAYSIVTARPAGHWAVSIEIVVDVCGTLPAPPAELRAVGRPIHLDETGGIARAEISTASGDLVAIGTQRLRFVAGEPGAVSGSPIAWPDPLVGGTHVRDVLGLKSGSADDGGRVLLPFASQLSNPMGNMHGGVLLGAVEEVGLGSLQDGGPALRTSSVQLVYVRGVAPGVDVSFEPVVHHRGRTLGVVSVIGRDPRGRVLVTGTVTGRTA